MGAETPEEKFDRLRDVLQELTLRAYPNPNREGCPGNTAIEEYALRVSAREETKGRSIEDHVQHCSPCYGEFLDVRERQRADAPSPAKMSWFRRRRLRKTLDQLESAMKSAARGARGE